MPLGNPFKARRMVGIEPAETSGVDHPAHLAEGWAVIKSAADASGNADLLDKLKAQGIEVEKMAPAALATMLTSALTTLPATAQGPAKALIAALGGTTKEAPVPDEPKDTTPPTLESLAAQVADLTKSLTASTTKATAEEEARKAAEVKAKTAEDALAAATKALSPAGEPTEEEALAKALGTLPEPLRKAFADQADRLAKAEKVANDERDARLSAEYLEKAKGFAALTAAPETLATVLRKAADALPADAVTELDRILKAADAQLREAGLWSEIGGGGGATGTAWEKIEAEATSLQKAAAAAGNDLTREQAVAKVGEIMPALLTQYNAEMAAMARDGR